MQSEASTRQRAVIVTVANWGPHEVNLDGLVVRLILAGSLTLGWRLTGLLTGGAHLKESPALPELPVPSLPENDMVSGFVDQSAFGTVPEARLTVVAYAPITMRAIERPTSKGGTYRLIGSCNGRTNPTLLTI